MTRLAHRAAFVLFILLKCPRHVLAQGTHLPADQGVVDQVSGPAILLPIMDLFPFFILIGPVKYLFHLLEEKKKAHLAAGCIPYCNKKTIMSPKFVKMLYSHILVGIAVGVVHMHFP